MSRTILLTLVLALGLSTTGCLAALKGAEEAEAATEEGVDALAAGADAMQQGADAMRQGMEASQQANAGKTNSTASTAPPVARITVFAAGGALLYKSNFQAEDPAEMIIVEEATTVKLIASDSEAIAPGATIKSYQWSMKGKALGSLGMAEAAVEGPGVYPVVLTVTDSNGRSDTQTVKLAVPPKPFDVVTNLTSEPVVGAEGEGQSATLKFKVTAEGLDAPAMVQGVKFTALAVASCDHRMVVTLPDGEKLSDVNKGDVAEREEIVATGVPEGEYTITLSPALACAAPQGIPVSITVTFLPHVEGFDMGHGGHGGHAH